MLRPKRMGVLWKRGWKRIKRGGISIVSFSYTGKMYFPNIQHTRESMEVIYSFRILSHFLLAAGILCRRAKYWATAWKYPRAFSLLEGKLCGKFSRVFFFWLLLFVKPICFYGDKYPRVRILSLANCLSSQLWVEFSLTFTGFSGWKACSAREFFWERKLCVVREIARDCEPERKIGFWKAKWREHCAEENLSVLVVTQPRACVVEES